MQVLRGFSRAGAAESGGVAGRQQDIIATSDGCAVKQKALQTVVNSARGWCCVRRGIFSMFILSTAERIQCAADAGRLKLQANLPLENRGISLQYADAETLAKAGGS
ncbi:hypothetical protein KCP70_09040 [Salmonella enterica subsp. enterica]|nr:hypothetical protein KCP70_09040 [Salmonella enterica subsp. enterica]